MEHFLEPACVDEFCRRFQIDREKAEAVGIDWQALREIVDHHSARQDELQTAGMVVTSALQRVPEVHSLKLRVKEFGASCREDCPQAH